MDRRSRSGRMTPRPVPRYRGCALAAGAGAWPTIIGGLSIPYAAIPINKRTGITIGGTRYFMVVPLIITWRRGLRRRGQDRRGALQPENISCRLHLPASDRAGPPAGVRAVAQPAAR